MIYTAPKRCTQCIDDGLFMSPSFQGLGIGRVLMDRPVQLRQPLALGVFKENTKGRNFY
ncbi:GNAT family N-acetyltransferase [Roseibium hamelinense]|nr:GNAT family N-acetyltransferase [Roseibium hamelinense]